MMFSPTKKIIPAISFFSSACLNNAIYPPSGVYHDCEAINISSIEINKGEEKLWWKNIYRKLFSINYDTLYGRQCVKVELYIFLLCFFIIISSMSFNSFISANRVQFSVNISWSTKLKWFDPIHERHRINL